MYLFLSAQRRPGWKVAKRWWEQDRLDLEGMQTEDQEAEQREGGKSYRRFRYQDGDGLNQW